MQCSFAWSTYAIFGYKYTDVDYEQVLDWRQHVPLQNIKNTLKFIGSMLGFQHL